jgi:rhodanese-related sulfurtransferase
MGTRKRVEDARRSRPGRTGTMAVVMMLTLLMALLSAQAGQPPSQGKVLHLDARGLDLMLHSDPNLLLIDIRTAREMTGPLGKIPESSNVSLGKIEKNPEQFPRDKTLVLICRTGHRSLKAADLLAEHGYVVYFVDGGMQTWRKLHPSEAPVTTVGAQQKKLDAPGRAPAAAKPSPPENRDRHSPENFFDSNMGC